jgi:uncharacterized protein YsxB (DUF464 family)
MTTSDWISGIAVIIASVITFVITTVYNFYQQKRKDRMNVFKTLVSFQCTELSPQKTEAVNLIRIIFYGDKNVMASYDKYINVLKKPAEHVTFDEIQDTYLGLLEEMAKTLGYKELNWKILKETYKPKGVIDNEYIQKELMRLQYELMKSLITQKALVLNHY